MPGLVNTPQVVRFGVFEVDLRAGELRKKGVKLRLQEQPLRVLAVLLDQRGDIVTREELKQKLWAGTIVDFDHSLNTTINKLREALGDSADTPRFIETLPRRGYRFICPVDDALTGAPTAAANGAATGTLTVPATASSDAGVVRKSRKLLVGLAAVLLALVALNVGGVRDRLVGRATAVEITAIAVLPLKNLSGDHQQDYFVDGMTGALITELGKIGALRVLSYQSMLNYRQTTKPLPQIARELNVDAFLEGAVLHSGERVRITANLVQASPERHLWGETYEFNLRDVVAVQGEVAREMARGVRVKVTPGEQARLSTSRRVDSEAYQAYLLARAHLFKTPTPTNWMRTKEYFEKAIDKDPGYAAAYGGLAELSMRHRGSSTRNPGDARQQARQWAEKALKLDDTLAEAHNALGRVAQQEWDWAGAEREYRRAIELNPSYPIARVNYAMLLYAMLRFDEAVVEARRAQQVDPASPFVNTWAGAAYFFAGRVDEAMASWQKALELDPGYADASLVLARTLLTQGNHERAIAELRKAVVFNEKQTLILGALAQAYARAGQREEALKLVGELKRIEADERVYVPPFGLIWAYAGLGDKEQAFAILERSFEERRDRMVWLNVDPLLDPLRSDSRFTDLVRRIGLPTRGSRQQ
jgi:TolB-like protein/DNA-binding winged helix-turn-helix (wHTH) protein/Flp pilus assembly protein TadD